nr:immunoglobulin light chain junction region [Macaca mulatta]
DYYCAMWHSTASGLF